MDFPGGFGGVRHRPRQEINLVPFIDVLLVLLVIFIVASPVLTHAVRLDLPKASSTVERREGTDIDISLLADGTILLDGAVATDSALEAGLGIAGARPDPPGARLRADGRVPYESVAKVLAAATRAGIRKVAFVSIPSRRP